MAAYYRCKTCDLRWQGDCWCERCGRVSPADTNHYRTANGDSPMPTEKWTKTKAREKFRAKVRKLRKLNKW